MEDRFSRTERLLGADAVAALAASRVAVFGIGGVGGAVVEALARSGIGTLDLTDSDTVSRSNLNRQFLATEETIGQWKVEVAAQRVHTIFPAAVVHTHRCFFLPETAERFDFSAYDYVVDAIDTVSGKLALIEHATAAGVPVIAAMGAGNKLDPTAFRVADITKTKVCPLARVMRTELRRRGIDHLKVVYSEEPPLTPVGQPAAANRTDAAADPLTGRPAQTTPKPIPGSVAFVPPVMGLILAGEVVKDLICRKTGHAAGEVLR